MSATSKIRNLSSQLHVGTTAYFDCPICGRKKKLGVTKFPDKLVYQCFAASCNIKGALSTLTTKESMASFLSSGTIMKATTEVFKLPDYLIDGFACEASIEFALRYGLMESYQQGLFRTAYDPRLNRQVFYYLNGDGEVVGAMGRALHGSVKPKAYIYPNSEKSLWILGKTETAVIVEDILSAVKVFNCKHTGIALSGTNLSLDYLKQLNLYTKIVIALDKDATIKSLELKKLLDFYCSNVIIVPIEIDFKDMSNEEATRILNKELLS